MKSVGKMLHPPAKIGRFPTDSRIPWQRLDKLWACFCSAAFTQLRILSGSPGGGAQDASGETCSATCCWLHCLRQKRPLRGPRQHNAGEVPSDRRKVKRRTIPKGKSGHLGSPLAGHISALGIMVAIAAARRRWRRLQSSSSWGRRTAQQPPARTWSRASPRTFSRSPRLPPGRSSRTPSVECGSPVRARPTPPLARARVLCAGQLLGVTTGRMLAPSAAATLSPSINEGGRPQAQGQPAAQSMAATCPRQGGRVSMRVSGMVAQELAPAVAIACRIWPGAAPAFRSRLDARVCTPPPQLDLGAFITRRQIRPQVRCYISVDSRAPPSLAEVRVFEHRG